MSASAVTVFMPLYNQGRFVEAAIRSVLAQTFRDFELLVIDDGSGDDGAEVVGRIDDPRLRLVANPTNLGQPATRNRGLDLARGRYFANLDSDDLAHPDRLARQYAFLEANPRCAAVGSWCGFVDERGRAGGRTKRHVTDPASIRAEMLFHCPVSHRALFGRTEVLRCYRYRPQFVVRQDVDLLCRLSRSHPLANVGEVLVWGRRHPGQITGRTHAQRRELHMRIMDQALGELGIDADAEELRRHFHIGRAWPDFKPDAEFLRWTSDWLHRIEDANAHALVHPPGALRRALGAAWARTCWQARPVLGPRSVTTFLSNAWSLAAFEALERSARGLARSVR